jgi:hypothetical protein
MRAPSLQQVSGWVAAARIAIPFRAALRTAGRPESLDFGETPGSESFLNRW